MTGTNRRHFIPSMIGPFLKVTLVPEKELRAATLPIFYDMIQSEQKTAGNFVMVRYLIYIVYSRNVNLMYYNYVLYYWGIKC